MSLKARRALVCASTAGLGLASAKALASAGVRVALVGRRGDVAVKEALALPGAIGLGADLTQPIAATEVVEAVHKAFGGVDILILNSGGPPPRRALETGDDDLQAALNLVLFPALRMIRLLVPQMVERGWDASWLSGRVALSNPFRTSHRRMLLVQLSRIS